MSGIRESVTIRKPGKSNGWKGTVEDVIDFKDQDTVFLVRCENKRLVPCFEDEMEEMNEDKSCP